ncbi:MAG: alpha-hydroxy-acid oxidizing protein [Marinosulfonomonas sp.]|nr:alpha-hydroxy-acid oxidizing protein [Marinosulfonomonas sp.]
MGTAITKPPTSKVPSRLSGYLSLEDFSVAARRRLPRSIAGYVNGASETEFTLSDNRQVFRELGFVPRVLTDVSQRTAQHDLFGTTYACPVGISPVGLSALVGYRGDLALAKSAAKANIPMVISGSSLIAMEQIFDAYPGAWFQAYLPGDDAQISALLKRVAATGCETLVLTVDTAVLANRENIIRSGFSTPLRPGFRLAWDGVTHPHWLLGTFLRTLMKHGMPHFENSYANRGAPVLARNVMRDFGKRSHLNWDHARAIRAQWQGRMVIKGILAPADVAIARDMGADGVILSNHGGRQLDGAISPLRALPQARDVAGDMALMIDSGFRRGSDVLKALMLGADFVFAGRPFLHALAVSGEPGITHAIHILKTEIERNMGLLGLNRLCDADAGYLTAITGPDLPSVSGQKFKRFRSIS